MRMIRICILCNFLMISKDLPQIDSLLSCLIRLMSNYQLSPHESQLMTLVQVIKQVQSHPDYQGNQPVQVAMEQALPIWQAKIQQLQQKACCQQIQAYKKNRSLH